MSYKIEKKRRPTPESEARRIVAEKDWVAYATLDSRSSLTRDLVESLLLADGSVTWNGGHGVSFDGRHSRTSPFFGGSAGFVNPDDAHAYAKEGLRLAPGSYQVREIA